MPSPREPFKHSANQNKKPYSFTSKPFARGDQKTKSQEPNPKSSQQAPFSEGNFSHEKTSYRKVNPNKKFGPSKKNASRPNANWSKAAPSENARSHAPRPRFNEAPFAGESASNEKPFQQKFGLSRKNASRPNANWSKTAPSENARSHAPRPRFNEAPFAGESASNEKPFQQKFGLSRKNASRPNANWSKAAPSENARSHAPRPRFNEAPFAGESASNEKPFQQRFAPSRKNANWPSKSRPNAFRETPFSEKSPSQGDTSWQKTSNWYNEIVGEKGHYYHQKIILPKSIELLDLKQGKESSLLDLACGQGVLGRKVPDTRYLGVDISPDFISQAKEYDKAAHHSYLVDDICQPLQLADTFTHAAIILALQNIRHPLNVFKLAATHLQPKGRLLIVLNHPCFRIPRQSNWQVDEKSKIQYRRINHYSSSLEIPIQMHPSQDKHSPKTLSFHHSLATYSNWLKEAGFFIESLDEWHSDKKSEGGRAKMEDISRREIPLFLAIVAIKK